MPARLPPLDLLGSKSGSCDDTPDRGLVGLFPRTEAPRAGGGGGGTSLAIAAGAGAGARAEVGAEVEVDAGPGVNDLGVLLLLEASLAIMGGEATIGPEIGEGSVGASVGGTLDGGIP